MTTVAGFVSAFALLCGGSPVDGIRPELQTVDAGDFYYYRGTPVRLMRSRSEWVLLADADQGRLAKLLEKLSPSARLAATITSEGRAFHIVTLPEAADGTSSSTLIARVRSEGIVLFVAPVFYDPARRARVLPTDEIIVRLATTVTRSDLVEIAAAHRLSVLRPMPGTTDQFILRLARPKQDDALERSRALHETNKFQWVEPNFVRDFQRTLK